MKRLNSIHALLSLVFFLDLEQLVNAQIDVEVQIQNVNPDTPDTQIIQNIQQNANLSKVNASVKTFQTLNYTAIINPCPRGYYCTANLTQEIACPRGTYQPNLNATNSSACLLCDAGTFSVATGVANRQDCEKCRTGTYSTASGANTTSTCVDCDRGTYNTGTGMPAPGNCLNCKQGTYGSQTRLIHENNCTLCPQGTFGSFPRAISLDNCTLCQRGTYNSMFGSNTSSACQNCSAGTYGATTGLKFRDNCTKCPGGYYGLTQGKQTQAEACIECARGTYSSGFGMIFVSNCTLCNPGTYSNVLAATLQATCSPCPTGTYSTGKGMDSLSLCQNCRPGTYQPSTGITTNSSCQPCAVDHYCPIASVQEKCPSGTFSNAGGISQLDCRCSAGFYCSYKEMITAVVSLNISKSAWDSNADQIQNKFKSAIAAAAGVTPADVIIKGVIDRSSSGSRRRRLLEKHAGGIHIITNILGTRKISNLQHHILRNGILSEGHVWSQNHAVIPNTLGAYHQIKM